MVVQPNRQAAPPCYNEFTMQLTKYDHACLLIDKDNARLLIDPGEYTDLPDNLANIGTIVITHEHADHLGVSNLRKVLEQSPQTKNSRPSMLQPPLRKKGLTAKRSKTN